MHNATSAAYFSGPLVSGINEYVCEYVCRPFDRAVGLDKLISTGRCGRAASQMHRHAVERS
jgi:hypothetical protein